MKRILIVDDSATARSIIRRCLEICGLQDVEVKEAGNGREALTNLKSEDFDLVFTDLNMPEMSGEQLLRRMKSSPKLVNIPVVVISSMTNPSKENQLLMDNASKIFSKPLSLNEMQDYLEEFIDKD